MAPVAFTQMELSERDEIQAAVPDQCRVTHHPGGRSLELASWIVEFECMKCGRRTSYCCDGCREIVMERIADAIMRSRMIPDLTGRRR